MVNQLIKNPWIYALIIAITLPLLFAYLNAEDDSPGEYDELATCLTQKGVIMYGTEWCSHCQNQKKAFGNSFKLINFVDCDANRAVCSIAGITGYPTWKINGKNYPGEMSLEELAELSDC